MLDLQEVIGLWPCLYKIFRTLEAILCKGWKIGYEYACKPAMSYTAF